MRKDMSIKTWKERREGTAHSMEGAMLLEIAELRAGLGHTKTLLGSAEMQISELRAKVSVRDAELDKLKKQEPDEQAAFEQWLEEVRPSGDHESVQYQWSQSSNYKDFHLAAGAQPQAELTDEEIKTIQYSDPAFMTNSCIAFARAVLEAQKGKQ